VPINSIITLKIMLLLTQTARPQNMQIITLGKLVQASMLSLACLYSVNALSQTLPGAPKPTRESIAAKADPSPFEFSPNAVQSAQMQPSLATPFIVLQKVPEPKNKNAIPEAIYKLISDKKYPEAIQAIEAELKANSRNVQLRFVRSRIEIEMGNLPAAKATLLEITQQFPELPEPYNNLAALEAETGRLDEAKEYLELALKVQPSFATAYENLGDVYTRLAARAYGKALTLDRKQIQNRRKMKLAEDILKPVTN
jgi:tetratricopeptide (TPR) repeat protein